MPLSFYFRGMSIPSQFFAPLADAIVESMKPYVGEGRQVALESLRWPHGQY